MASTVLFLRLDFKGLTCHYLKYSLLFSLLIYITINQIHSRISFEVQFKYSVSRHTSFQSFSKLKSNVFNLLPHFILLLLFCLYDKFVFTLNYFFLSFYRYITIFFHGNFLSLLFWCKCHSTKFTFLTDTFVMTLLCYFSTFCVSIVIIFKVIIWRKKIIVFFSHLQ